MYHQSNEWSLTQTNTHNFKTFMNLTLLTVTFYILYVVVNRSEDVLCKLIVHENVKNTFD